MPARPLVFALGLLLTLAGAITCATAAADDPHAFPSLSDALALGGLLLVVVGVAGRDPRGRQLLGRHPADLPDARASTAQPSIAAAHAQPSADPHAPGSDPPA